MGGLGLPCSCCGRADLSLVPMAPHMGSTPLLGLTGQRAWPDLRSYVCGLGASLGTGSAWRSRGAGGLPGGGAGLGLGA